MIAESPALAVRELHCAYRVRGDWPWRRLSLPAVRGTSFEIARGETLGLVGESGCGKSTLARALLRLVEPDSGEVRVGGRALTGIAARELRLRRRGIQMVFQDPDRSLSPRRTVARTLREALSLLPRAERGEPAVLLDMVGLDETVLSAFPHELSGGQRQRVAIARALAPRPEVLVADEPVSALDVSVQAQILNLLSDLQREYGLTMLFISHDLAVVRQVADRVAVMHEGKIVEEGPVERVLRTPRHAYTQSLLDAVPDPFE